MSTRRIVTISVSLMALAAMIFALSRTGLFEPAMPGSSSVDFAKLERTPGSYLVAPDGFAPGKSDGEAPVLGVSAEKLKENWMALMARQPDIEKVAESADGMQIEYVQRGSSGTEDAITVRFIAMPSDPETGSYATLAVYARPVRGDGTDLQERVTKWLNRL